MDQAKWPTNARRTCGATQDRKFVESTISEWTGGLTRGEVVEALRGGGDRLDVGEALGLPDSSQKRGCITAPSTTTAAFAPR